MNKITMQHGREERENLRQQLQTSNLDGRHDISVSPTPQEL